jgi:hypothetical protein
MRGFGAAILAAALACPAPAALMTTPPPALGGVYRGSAIIVRDTGSDDVGLFFLNGATVLAAEAIAMLSVAAVGRDRIVESIPFAPEEASTVIINGSYQFDPSSTLTGGGYLVCLWPRDRYALLFLQHGCLLEQFALPYNLQP